MSLEAAWCIAVGSKLTLIDRGKEFARQFGEDGRAVHEDLIRYAPRDKRINQSNHTRQRVTCKWVTHKKREVRSFQDGVVVGQRTEFVRQSSALKTTLALISPTPAASTTALRVFNKVLEPPPRGSMLPRRVCSVKELRETLPKLIVKAGAGEIAYPSSAYTHVAPLRNLKVFIGHTLVYSCQIMTVRSVSSLSLHHFGPDRPIPTVIFQTRCMVYFSNVRVLSSA
jgi:hypothetical protein